jgi:hypothetical protein
MAGWWVSPGTPVSSTKKTDHHDITEILLKVALNTIKPTKPNHKFEMKISWKKICLQNGKCSLN